MKVVKIVIILFVIYAGVVAAFETWLGTSQPTGDGTLVITTTNDAGQAHDRVVSRIEVEGQMYVAANHWPRSWYTQVLEHPEVQVNYEGETGDYVAVPVTGAEHDKIDGARPLPTTFRILTGFPPRYFVRLDPKS